MNDLDLLNVLASNIKKYRLLNDLTIEQFAEISNISTVTISKIENGKANPSISILWKLAKTLNVKLSQLFIDSHSEKNINNIVNRYLLSNVENTFIVKLIYTDIDTEIYQGRLKPYSSYRMSSQDDQSEEIITVLAGTLKIEIGNITHVLNQFDVLNFRSNLTHMYINETDEDVLMNIIVKY